MSSDPPPTAEQTLPAEVRQQLLTIAADVVGRTPMPELPSAVRRFARFAPAKRLRLGAAEIAAALAADDGFRRRVADVVTEASPELVGQVTTSGAPATADPTDVAVIAYLVRPPGWERLLQQSSDALTEQQSRHSAGADVERLTAELARLRATHEDVVRARDAARVAARATAVEHAEELAELQRRLRTMQGELRSAQRVAQAALAEATAARTEQRRAQSGTSSELRKARNRIAELETQLGTERRGQRSERDHDEARLWLLLEQLSAAANGLRRELDVGRPAVLPADRVATSAGQQGTRPSTLDPALLERVLDGGHVHLIVDGYNLTKLGYPELTLAEQRSRLISSLGALASRTGVEVTVAFDGTAAPIGAAASLPTPRGVRVLFSAPGQLADDLIRSLLAAEPPGRTVLVASSDEEVASSARRSAAWPVGAAVLLSRLDRA